MSGEQSPDAIDLIVDELIAARRFKTYVHARLDAAGVPADPEPDETRRTGCRIEGRLSWLIAQSRAARTRLWSAHS